MKECVLAHLITFGLNGACDHSRRTKLLAYLAGLSELTLGVWGRTSI